MVAMRVVISRRRWQEDPMSCDPVVHFWLYDWQTLVAGVLAVVAGIGTIWATRDAATRQIATAAGQIAIAERQLQAAEAENQRLRTVEKRERAGRSLIACRMLEGVLAILEEQADRVAKEIPGSNNLQYTLNPVEIRELFTKIRKPELGVVWGNLGMIEFSTGQIYMRLDFLLSNWQQIEASNWPSTKVESVVREIASLAKAGRQELSQTAHSMNQILADGQ
jgi:hypothetical protein